MVAPPPPLVADLSRPPLAWKVNFSCLPPPPNPWSEISAASVPDSSISATSDLRAGEGVETMVVEVCPDELETPALVVGTPVEVVRFKVGEEGAPVGDDVLAEVKEDPDAKGVKIEEAVEPPPPPPPVAVEAVPPPPPLVAADNVGANVGAGW